MSFAPILVEEFRKSNLEVSDPQLELLERYAGEIEHWNKSVNLTALTGAALVRRLIVEPVWVGRHLPMNGVVADVGSGNGSPGIPLCITGNFSAAFLIEPRMKRAAFLRHVVAKLALKNVSVLRSRIEELSDGVTCADWIVLQAIDPNRDILLSIRRMGLETTRVVWITSIDGSPVPAATKLEIPGSATKIWIFRLDQI